MLNTNNIDYPLLQIIKDNLNSTASNDAGRKPTSNEIIKYLNTLNTHSLSWVHKLWTCQNTIPLTVKPDQQLPLERIFTFLALYPAKQSVFYEIQNSEVEFGSQMGLLFFSDELKLGGYVHVLLLIDKSFPDRFIKAFELNPNENGSGPFLTEISDESKTYNKDEFYQSTFYDLITSVIYKYYENPIDQNYIPLSQIVEFSSLGKINSKNEPPIDLDYEELLAKAIRNEIPCFRVTIDSKNTKLFDEQFINTISSQIIQDEIKRHETLNVLGPLVYWNNLKQSFIVSDDYLEYIALLSREINPIPAIIMGNFPKSKATIIESGFNELIPGIYLIDANSENDDILKNRILESQIISNDKKIKENFLQKYGEIWIGINPITFGLYLSPEYEDGEWYNKNFEVSEEFIPWTIGHILTHGLLVPQKEKKQTFESLDSFIDFYTNVLVRHARSIYQQKIAEEYCKFLKQTKNPENVPFLVPEYRFGGQSPKHLHRLDFVIFNFKQLAAMGVEISPWSTHGKLKNIKAKTTGEINKEAQTNRALEIKKRLQFFRTHNIHILTYSDDELQNMEALFNDLKRYLL